MENIIIILIIICIITGIVFYLRKEKKRGNACIGCPYCKQCSGKHNGGCEGGNSCGTSNCQGNNASAKTDAPK